MVIIKEKTEEEKKMKNLMERVSTVACEMFGEENVSVFPNTTIFGIYGGEIMVGCYSVDRGYVRVRSSERLDDAMKFSERYESDIFGRENSVTLEKNYFDDQ